MIKYDILRDREADFFGFTVRKNMIYGIDTANQFAFATSLERSKNSGRGIKCYVYDVSAHENGAWKVRWILPEEPLGVCLLKHANAARKKFYGTRVVPRENDFAGCYAFREDSKRRNRRKA